MTTHAHGTFEVTLTPLAPAAGEEPTLGRLLIDKQFLGDLAGLSQGQMLAYRTEVEGSAGYVALERFTGALHGRPGALVLQHNGRMDRGQGTLTITIVPDSGTGDLAGIAGQMTIDISDGQHAYVLEYTLT